MKYDRSAILKTRRWGIPAPTPWGLWAMALALALLTGCGSGMVNLPTDYRMFEGTSTGVVVFSFTNTMAKSRGIFGAACSKIDYLELKLRKAGEKKYSAIHAFGGGGPSLPGGRLVAVNLAGGDYELFQWMGEHLMLSDTTKQVWGNFSYKFSVAAGKVTYLGNLHIHIQDPNLVADPCGEKGMTTIFNTRERDLKLLFSHYPALAGTPVVNLAEKLDETQRGMMDQHRGISVQVEGIR